MLPTILTNSGRTFNLMSDSIEEIAIEDIAHALSHVCRFTGHVGKFYSVAQHSVLASFYVEQKYAQEALLHDAAEAYIGDVSTPLKRLLKDYQAIEAGVEQRIASRFCLNWDDVSTAAVKTVDNRLLVTERRDLFSHLSILPELGVSAEPYPEVITPWSPEIARLAFMERATELGFTLEVVNEPR